MKRILGMGNALTDILLQIDSDEVLSRLALPKGSMQLVDGGKSNEITEKIFAEEFSTQESRRMGAFFNLKAGNELIEFFS